MRGSSPVRWMPLTGIGFVALWMVAFAVALGGTEGESDAAIVAHYADEANRSKAVTLFFLIVAATLLFVGFLTLLRSRLAGVDGQAGALTALSFGAGLIAAALWLVAAVFWMAVAYTANETVEFSIDPDAERLVSEMAYLFWVTGMFSAIPVVLGASLLVLKTLVLPRVVGWLGLLVAVSLLGALGGFPFFLFLGWILLVSVMLLLRPERALRQAPASSAR